MMSKRSPEQILQDIEDSDLDDVVDQVLAQSPEDRRRDLAAAGFDLKALDEKADALHAKLQQAEPEPQNPAPSASAGGGGNGKPAKGIPFPVRSRRVVWMASLLAAAVGGGSLLMTGTGVQKRDRDHAAELRQRAIAACDAHRWDECKKELDDAKAIDADGEDEARVKEARRALKEAGH
jgi:hypothetical protein